ncbi:MAG: mycofactocin biosynthesis glycosyltransferase MftF [Nocardiaceae bacterium]|nr:mycofactocin biosynthesis glycosyltransferase MftF [Nocardiaceae bacterium]
MRQGRLPNGFGVRIDPAVRSYSGGQVLFGGMPMKLLKLTPSAASMIGDGYLRVSDPKSAVVARRLLDSGVANPRPELSPSMGDVTVIIPVRNNTAGLNRLLSVLRGHNVIVVDDASDDPARIIAEARCRVSVIRHEIARGPAAARNTGLRAATTDFVAFLDADVVPKNGWLELMLSHFSDPSVALVAPRMLRLDPDANLLSRYESGRTAFDLGRRESAIESRGVVTYVPSAAVLLRREALLEEGGFDEIINVAEDIDVCMRLERAGWRLRYEPAAHVDQDSSESVRQWLQRKARAGAASARLGERHPGMVSPVTISPSTAAAGLLLASLTRVGWLAALLTFVGAVVRMRTVFSDVDGKTKVAAIYTGQGFAFGFWRLVSAMFRQYWPVTAVAMVVSPRIRKVAVAAAIAEGAVDWFRYRNNGTLDPVRYIALKRADDLAYGAGLWAGVFDSRNAEALRPNVR